MEMISSLLTSLGINDTLFIQLGLYLVSFIVLYVLVFKAYFNASEERRKLTSGNMESAGKAEESIKKTQEKYQTRARQINDEISLLFKEQRTAGLAESDEIMSKAVQSSKEIMSQAQQKLSDQLEQVQAQINTMAKDVSGVIVTQLLSKRGKD